MVVLSTISLSTGESEGQAAAPGVQILHFLTGNDPQGR